jgi:ABC-type lipoprotein release transport system permease subunit
MLLFRPLPWDYGVRNLLRRPGRSALSLAALATVVLLVFVVVGFIRGLETSLAASGDARVAIVHSHGAAENLENSSVPASTAALFAASLGGVQRRYGVQHVSPELYLGTMVQADGAGKPALGLVRGVEPAATLVRRQVQLIEGSWPQPGEVLAGRLSSAKLGCPSEALAVGRQVSFEGRFWRVSGRFAARGSAMESELWCPLVDLQQALKRQDVSFVALLLSPRGEFSEVDTLCKERLDLEVQALRETDYYASLQRHYGPVRMLAWLVVALVSGAGVFAGLNTMYGAVVGRVRELAALQTIGFARRAIVLSLVQEGTLLAASGSLVAAALALAMLNGAAVRFTMGAFALRVDSAAIVIGCGAGLFIGVLGSLPAAIHAMRQPIAEGLKAV